MTSIRRPLLRPFAVRIGIVLVALLAAPVGASDLAAQTRDETDDPIVVGSKPFGESLILGEMFARLLEERGFVAERRLGLGNTELAFEALRSGAIDVYPEYTGTGLLAILGEDPEGGPQQVFQRVQAEFRSRWNLHWLPPLGFENTYAMAVRSDLSNRLGIRSLSDLSEHGDSLVGGLTPDFIGRSDGLPGLRGAYGLNPREVRALLQSVKYRALDAGEVDFVDGYSTDALIERYDLVVLEDDLGFFPPYQAAALIGSTLHDLRPDAALTLTELSGRIDVTTMRALNRRLEVDGEEIADVAFDALRELGLISADPEDQRARRADSGEESLLSYLWRIRSDLGRMTARHLLLVGLSLLFAILTAIPFGLLLERRRASAEGSIRAIGVIQTIPSIALLAFMIPILGIGVTPAVVALLLYSLFPILRNTYSGVRDAAPEAVNAARAVGMTEAQILRYVRLPLAAPFIMAGIRTAAVINVGTATLAAFIGAGGLGDPIVAGLALADTRMILSGAIPAALLALWVDGLLAWLERGVTPRGVRAHRASGSH